MVSGSQAPSTGFGCNASNRRRSPGIFADQQRVDAAVLEELDRHALERTPVVGNLCRAPAAVADHVGQHRAVAVDPRYAAFRLEDVRHAHAELVEIRHRLAHLVEGGGVGHELVAVAPEGAQIQVELALDVGEQRAAALALQHRAAVGEREGEIFLLPFRMAAVIEDAVLDPVLQAAERQQIQQEGRLFEQRDQAGAGEGAVVAMDRAGGARHQVARDVEVALQLPGRLQAARHGGQGLQERRDGPAVRRFLQRPDQVDHRRQGIAADGVHHRGPFLEEYQHRLRAAAELAEIAGGLEVSLHLRPAHRRQRFVDAFLEDIRHLLEAAIHRRPVGLDLRVRHLPFGRVCHGSVAVLPALTFRRRWRRWRDRGWRGCRRRR